MTTLVGPRPLLSIAGSDPTAGAGIEADLLTFARHGYHGTAVITALTTQDTRGVTRVGATDPKEFQRRLEVLLKDVRPRCWKIGLQPSAEHARVVARAIETHQPEIVVLDPILAATNGARFLDDRALAMLRDRLFPLVTVLTPNLAEAAAFAGSEARFASRHPLDIAYQLLSLGPRAILLKGGHGRDANAVDLLVTRERVSRYRVIRRLGARRDVHGTGCALSAALLCALADGLDPHAATARAKRFVTRAIDDSGRLGSGRNRLGLVRGRSVRPNR